LEGLQSQVDDWAESAESALEVARERLLPDLALDLGGHARLPEGSEAPRTFRSSPKAT